MKTRVLLTAAGALVLAVATLVAVVMSGVTSCTVFIANDTRRAIVGGMAAVPGDSAPIPPLRPGESARLRLRVRGEGLAVSLMTLEGGETRRDTMGYVTSGIDAIDSLSVGEDSTVVRVSYESY